MAALATAALCVLLWWLGRDNELRRAFREVARIADADTLVIVTPQERFADLALLSPELNAIASNTLPMETTRYERVILVRDASHGARSLRRTLGAKATLVDELQSGDTAIDIFDVKATETVIADLGQDLQTASVWVTQRGEPRRACPWLTDRFDCPDADWTWVGASTEVFEGQPIPCIWSHPVDNATLFIQFPTAEGATHVTGWYGLTDYAAAMADGAPVTLKLEAEGSTASFRSHRQRGRRPITFKLPEDYVGPIQLQISASRSGVRHLCWDLQLVRIDDP